MSLLRSYSFNKVVTDDIWNLFKDADINRGWDYSLEIIENAMSGGIQTSKSFSFYGYINNIEKNRRLEKHRSAKRHLHIKDSYDEEESYGVPESALNTYVPQDDPYQKIDDDEEVYFAVNEINKMASEFLIFNKVNIQHCVRQALKGIPDAVSELKKLVEEDPHAGEMLRIILGSGYSFDILFSTERR